MTGTATGLRPIAGLPFLIRTMYPQLFLSRRLKVVFFVVMGLLITTSLAGALLTAALGYVVSALLPRTPHQVG